MTENTGNGSGGSTGAELVVLGEEPVSNVIVPVTTALDGTSVVQFPIGKRGKNMQSMAELDAAGATALENLHGLTEDGVLPADLQEGVQILFNRANPVKPGMEEVDAQWKVERVVLCQNTTNVAYKPEQAKPGDIFTSAGILLKKPFDIIPIAFFEGNIKFSKGDTQAQIDCSAPDSRLGMTYGACDKCKYQPFGKQDAKWLAAMQEIGLYKDILKGKQVMTDCANQMVCVALSVETWCVYEIPFSKTSRGAGTVLKNLVGQGSTAWDRVFRLDTEKKVGKTKENQPVNYFVFKVLPTDVRTSAEKAKIAEALYHLYTAGRRRTLADYYLRPSQAAKAVANEIAGFDPGSTGIETGGTLEEPDLSAPAVPASRSSARPM